MCQDVSFGHDPYHDSRSDYRSETSESKSLLASLPLHWSGATPSITENDVSFSSPSLAPCYQFGMQAMAAGP